MTKKTVYILVIGCLAAFVVANVVVPNPHPHFAWNKITGFYGMFGLAAGLALIGIALGLGNFFLWRPTWSVQLDESLLPPGATQASLRTWHVEMENEVRQGDALATLGAEDGAVTITSPVDGVVRKIFYHPGDSVDVGWTLVDLEVSRSVMHHGIDKRGGER